MQVNLTNMAESVRLLCLKLKDQYPANSVFAQLKMADRNFTNMFEGLLVETTRDLISYNHGDLLRMPANAIYESQAPRSMVHRVFMSDFPIGDEIQFNASAKRLVDFLMRREKTFSVTPFWKKPCFVSKDVALDKVFSLAYVPPPTAQYTSPHSGTSGAAIVTATADGASSPHGHVTRGFVTPGMREYLKQRLLVDPVVGPLLHVIQAVLYRTSADIAD